MPAFEPFVHDQKSIGRLAQTIEEEHAALQACLNNFWSGLAILTVTRLANGWELTARLGGAGSPRRGRGRSPKKAPPASRRVGAAGSGKPAKSLSGTSGAKPKKNEPRKPKASAGRSATAKTSSRGTARKTKPASGTSRRRR